MITARNDNCIENILQVIIYRETLLTIYNTINMTATQAMSLLTIYLVYGINIAIQAVVKLI